MLSKARLTDNTFSMVADGTTPEPDSYVLRVLLVSYSSVSRMPIHVVPLSHKKRTRFHVQDRSAAYSTHPRTVFSRRYIRATPPLAVTIVFPDYARPSQHTHSPKMHQQMCQSGNRHWT